MKTAKSSRIISLLALLLVAVMMLTMVGCGGDKEPTGGESTTAPTESTTTTAPESTTAPSESTTAPSESTTAPSQSTTAPSQSTTAPTQSTNAPSQLISRTNASTTITTTASTSVSTQPVGDNVLDQVPDSLKGTKITMFIWWTAGEADNSKAEDFKKATGIEVKYESASMDNYQKNLAAKVMAQNSPAIAAIINEWYPQPISRGLMQALDDVKVAGLNFKDDEVYAISLMDQFGYKGKHYGLNLKTSTNCTFEVMFFNKDILKQRGVKEDPYQLWEAGKWNWDTCLEIAKKCTDAKRGLSGITNTYQNYWMLSAGEDFVKSTKAGLKNNVKSTELYNAWEWNWNMIYTHKVVDTSYTAQTPFYQGKAAMFGGGSYMMQYGDGKTTYVPQNMKDKWSVVPFPSPKGKTYAAAEGTVWGFPTRVTGAKLEAAAWYLRYYLDEFNIQEIKDTFYDPDHPECWKVMDWMWDQKIQSFNSVGVLTYGGEYSAASIQYSLLDEADTTAKLKSNLDTWYSVLDANISKIESELG